MQPITITLLDNDSAASANAAVYIENALDRIRRRAFELYESRTHGDDMLDWLQAERELFFVPDADCIDCVDDYVIKAKTPGFASGQLIVVAEPHWITIQGLALLDENAQELFRRLFLESAIDPVQVKAHLEDEELTVVMPKAEKQVPITVTTPPEEAKPSARAATA